MTFEFYIVSKVVVAVVLLAIAGVYCLWIGLMQGRGP